MNRPAPGRLGAATVLLGTALSLVGITWDVQWHVDVGPDTFFTLSHLLLYSGSAVSGAASLVMVLRATAAQRAGRAPDPEDGGRTVRVLGVFHAPLGYLVSGTGAALFLLYGLADLWWHTIYGFDATLASPPHIALFSAITITMVGAVIVYGFAAARPWGRIGLILALPVLMIFSPITTNAFDAVPLPFDATTVGTAFFCSVCMILAVALIRRTGTATSVAVVLGVMQAALWFFAPWAAHTYAAYVGLPLRDNIGNEPPDLPSTMPMFLLLAAIAIDVVLRTSARRGWPVRWMPQAAGAVAGVLITATFLLQARLLGEISGVPLNQLLMNVLAGAAFGALAGFLGWRFAGIARGERPPAPRIVPAVEEAF